MLEDGEGGYIPAVFDPNESNEDHPFLYIDAGGGTLILVDTSPLGPWGLDMAPGFAEMVTQDESGTLFYVTPDPVLVTGEMIGAPGLSVVDENGQPALMYLVNPGNLNGAGTIGSPVPPPTEMTASVPEPTALTLAVLAAGAAGRLSRRR